MLSVYLSTIETKEERDTFVYIYTHFRKQMLLAANRIVNNPYDAEDIVHNTFVTISKNLKLFENKSDKTIHSYLIQATKGHAHNYIKKNDAERRAIHRSGQKLPKGYVDDFVLKIEYDLILDAIRKLNDIYSTVLYLYYIEEMTYTEVANLLGRKPKTVRKQIERGKEQLCHLLGVNNKL